MIPLPLSEAEAFDYYSILEVKRDRGLNVKARIHAVAKALCASCDFVDTVFESAEYAALVAANSACFDVVELAHRDEVAASRVQLINHERFLAKRALQRRFWPASPLTERKTLDTPLTAESAPVRGAHALP